MGVQGVGGCAPFTLTEVSLFEKGRPSPTLIKAGVERAQPHPRGVWGMCPQNKKEGASCHISNLPTRGAQNAGEP